MKSLLKLFLLVPMAFISFEKVSAHIGKDFENYSPFRIINTTIDKTLPENSARLKVTFYENDSICTKNFEIGFNDVFHSDFPDPKGIYTHNLQSGKYRLHFQINGCEEIVTDTIQFNSQEIIEAEIYFPLAQQMKVVFKPVIYLYPVEEMNVNIKLDVNGNLGFTYPAYNEGWKFTASPDGKINMDGKQYNYLFWDSEMPTDALDPNEKTGFLVSSDTLLSFLENSLDQMGFNSMEAADFMTFWYPQMMKNEKNHIHFLFNEACEAYAELSISPKPDHIFRVGMVWTEAKTDFIPEKQIIPTLNRNGFTVIEWGGIINNLLFTNEN